MPHPLDNTEDIQVSFLATTNRARAKTFYVDILGLTFQHEDDFALVLRCGNNPVRISEMQKFTPQPFAVLGWEVTDIEERAQRLIDAGIELIRYPGLDYVEPGLWLSPSTGAQICWFHDPDGNLLSLSQHS